MKEQRVFQGNDSFNNLETIIDKNNYKKIFMVTGKSSYQRCGAEKKVSSILTSKDYIVFNDFEINPKFEDVKKGLVLYNQFKADLIIAIGGGTVLDMAKLINAFSCVKEDLESYVTGNKNISKSNVPLVAIPTTSGTGSEATHFAVVYLNEVKYSVADSSMLPDYVILDSSLTISLPKYITAYTAMDAFSHGIESYWSVNSTEESLSYSKKAIELSIKCFQAVLTEPNKQNREEMQQAAFYAGKAINITKTTAAHAFSYFLTSKYGIPHGHAVGIVLGWVFEENLNINDDNCNDPRGVGFVKSKMNSLCHLLGIKDKDAVEEFFNRLLEPLSDKTSFILNNGTKQKLLDNVNLERMKNNPVQIRYNV